MLSSNQPGNISTQQIIKLFPFQEIGVEFLLKHQRCLLTDEVGLGKTLQVLAAIDHFQASPLNILVICPASLTLMWEWEIIKWFKTEPHNPFIVSVTQLKSTTEKVRLLGSLRFIICSYNYLQKQENVDRLLKKRWDVIVSDESHFLKNFKSKTCKGFITLAKKHTGYLWMLTATPATNNGQDYYPYLEIIQPGKWGNLWEFSQTFCDVVWNSGYKHYEGVRDSKKAVLRKAFSKIMLRRRKSEVLTELPKVLSKYLPIEVRPEVVAASLSLDKDLITKILEKGLPIPAHIQSVLIAIGVAKVSAAVEFISNLGEPVVVFCTHTDVVERIASDLAFIEDNIPVVRITGSESAEEKNKNVNLFQTGAIDVAICNVNAGGVGITLHRASHVLFVEHPWSPAVREQCIGRLDRIGQKASCISVTDLVAVGTIDETVLRVIQEKWKFMREVMNDT